MLLRKIIESFGLRQIFLLIREFIYKPSFILPTYRATKQTIKICDERFGREHHKETRANAYRHALWNYLLCEEYLKVSGSKEIAIAWSKKITDLHEKVSPNSKIAKAMDLHNNLIGRELFSGEKMNIRERLQMMTNNAKQVDSIEEIANSGHQLVFLED